MAIKVEAEVLERLNKRYGSELVEKAITTVDTYAAKITNDAVMIIKKSGYVDIGTLSGSVGRVIKVDSKGITGTVEVGKAGDEVRNYANIIHEGAKQESGGRIVPFFVPFKPRSERSANVVNLFMWAERNGVIYRKTKRGKVAKKNSNIASSTYAGTTREQYYFKSKRTGKEYRVNIETGGLVVKIRPAKYFTKPFLQHKDDFFREMRELVRGDA